MDKGIKDKMERMKAKAELFLNQNIKAFINTIQGDYYFCDIILVGDLKLEVYSFVGKRSGQKDYLYWTDIVDINEYKARSEK